MLARRFFYVSLGILALAVAYHLGASTTGAAAAASQIPTEVAVKSGSARDFDVLPLPVYADGTEALESECSWIVSAKHPNVVDPVRVDAGRVVRVAGCCYPPEDQVAHYMIIAVRDPEHTGVTSPAMKETNWGALKGSFGR